MKQTEGKSLLETISETGAGCGIEPFNMDRYVPMSDKPYNGKIDNPIFIPRNIPQGKHEMGMEFNYIEYLTYEAQKSNDKYVACKSMLSGGLRRRCVTVNGAEKNGETIDSENHIQWVSIMLCLHTIVSDYQNSTKNPVPLTYAIQIVTGGLHDQVVDGDPSGKDYYLPKHVDDLVSAVYLMNFPVNSRILVMLALTLESLGGLEDSELTTRLFAYLRDGNLNNIVPQLTSVKARASMHMMLPTNSKSIILDYKFVVVSGDPSKFKDLFKSGDLTSALDSSDPLAEAGSVEDGFFIFKDPVTNRFFGIKSETPGDAKFYCSLTSIELLILGVSVNNSDENVSKFLTKLTKDSSKSKKVK